MTSLFLGYQYTIFARIFSYNLFIYFFIKDTKHITIKMTRTKKWQEDALGDRDVNSPCIGHVAYQINCNTNGNARSIR